MQCFKNIIVYQLNKPFSLSNKELENVLVPLAFTPCGELDNMKLGWKAPDPSQESQLVFEMQEQLLICCYKEEKIIPASVVKKRLAEKVARLEADTHKKLKKSDKDRIKDEVIQQLLPLAFSKSSSVQIWINRKDNLIFVDTASTKRAEEALSLLRKCIGSLSAVPFKTETPIESLLTQWVITQSYPSSFVALDEFELKQTQQSGAIIRCKSQEIDNEDILRLIKNGMQVTKLKLEWQQDIQFTLSEDGTLKRLNYTESLKKENEIDEKANDIDAEFLLMNGKISLLFNSLWQ